jgi:hypothetical protein
MSSEVEFAAFTLAAPLAAAAATAWLLWRLLPKSLAQRYSLAAGLAAGFAVGYFLLPDEWAPLAPVQHWHWLPYLGVAAVLAAIGLAHGTFAIERWLAYGLLALVMAWQLVPLWPDLYPPRVYTVPLIAAYVLLMAGLLTALPDRLLGRAFIALLAASAATVAIAVGLEVSGKFGQVAAAAAAATAGSFAATCFRTPASSTNEGFRGGLATAIRGLVPVFAVLAGGAAFIGAIEPTPPLPILLVPPAAPLVLWLFACGPLARLSGFAAPIAHCAAVFLILLIALAPPLIAVVRLGFSSDSAS